MQNKGGEVPGFGAIFLVYQGKRSSGCVNQHSRQKRKNIFLVSNNFQITRKFFKSTRKKNFAILRDVFFRLPVIERKLYSAMATYYQKN